MHLGETTQQKWSRVEATFDRLSVLKKGVESAFLTIDSTPELVPLALKIKQLTYELEQLRIAQAKRLRVNIGEEDPSTLADAFEHQEGSHAKLRKTLSKSMARKLYMQHHPDLGGDPEVFHLIRKAAKAGEVEFLRMMSMKKDSGLMTPENIDDLLAKVLIQESIFKSTPAFKLASLYYSNRPAFIQECKKALLSKIVHLEQLLLTQPAY